MTTLDVHLGQLRTAVAPYPVVKDLQVSTQFPHGMRIHVIEQLAGRRDRRRRADGRRQRRRHAAPRRADGVAADDPARVRSRAGRTSPTRPPGTALTLLAATPQRLEAKISQVTTTPPHGLVVQLRSGPASTSATADELAAKWVAATEVLAAPGSAGAAYIDVTDPARPAAGVGAAALRPPGSPRDPILGGLGERPPERRDTASTTAGDTTGERSLTGTQGG